MELTIRYASKSDFPDLTEISRNTWDGHDYLERVSPHWLKDGHFLVGELEGKVVACGKITMMPGRIAWLEGLRVHPDFQGKGFGKVISRRILDLALKETDEGVFSAIEFSTYVNNVESRGMAEKQGFKVTEWFHVVGREEPFPSSDVKVYRSQIKPGDLDIYRDHTPCGWKFIHSDAPDSIEWLSLNAQIWQVSTGARFLSCNRDFEISPLKAALDDPKGFIAGAMNLMGEQDNDYSEMMIHDEHKDLLAVLVKEGWEYWEEPEQPNIPVYRYFPGFTS